MVNSKKRSHSRITSGIKKKTRTRSNSISSQSLITRISKTKTKPKGNTKGYTKGYTTGKTIHKTINNKHSNVSNVYSREGLSDEQISIRFTSGKFLSRTKTAYSLKRESLVKDKVLEFIDDHANLLLNKKVLSGRILDKEIFNHSDLNCICENIFKKHIQQDCNCSNMETYSSQGKSGASIHSIQCTTSNSNSNSDSNSGIEKQILKVVPLTNYYIKLRQETKKYIFLELDGFTIQTLINTYVYRELPLNTVNIVHSGVCSKSGSRKDYGYNLMAEADLGSGRIFINDLINGKYDKEFNIENSDDRYMAVVNFLLQSIFIIGHLQSSSLEFFHGDYKPDNVFVKRTPISETEQYTFNIFGHNVKVKNLGFAVLIADFDRSSISLLGDRYNKKYRIISPILFKPFLTSYINEIITNYGDVDPDNMKGDVFIKKLFISNIIPHSKDPTITILRSAGVKLYRDFDLYTFMIKLLDTDIIRKFIVEKKIDKTILSFMSDNFKKELFAKSARTVSLNESAYIAVNILNTLKEPIQPIFTTNYIKTLNLLNYRLFRN
jgi:hypothetical protein